MHPENVDKIVIQGKLEYLELGDVENLLARQKAEEERKALEKAKKEERKAAEEAEYEPPSSKARPLLANPQRLPL